MKRLGIALLLTAPLLAHAQKITLSQEEYAALSPWDEHMSAATGKFAAHGVFHDLYLELLDPRPWAKPQLARLLAAHSAGVGAVVPKGLAGNLPPGLLDPRSLPPGGAGPTLAQVPEPGSLVLLGAGLICLALLRRRQYPAPPKAMKRETVHRPQ